MSTIGGTVELLYKLPYTHLVFEIQIVNEIADDIM